MSNRLIINNNTDLSDGEALAIVSAAVEEGRISKGPRGDQYCWATGFNKGYTVYATRNERSDSFRIELSPRQRE